MEDFFFKVKRKNLCYVNFIVHALFDLKVLFVHLWRPCCVTRWHTLFLSHTRTRFSHNLFLFCLSSAWHCHRHRFTQTKPIILLFSQFFFFFSSLIRHTLFSDEAKNAIFTNHCKNCVEEAR